MSIEFEKLEKIVVFFWDDSENFFLEKTQQKIGKLFKKVHHINSLESFTESLNYYSDSNQQFLCFVHLSHSKENKGYDDFINSKILKVYPNLRFYLITSALRNQVYDKERQNETLDVYTYDRYQEKIFSTFIPQTKLEITNLDIEQSPEINCHISNQYQCDYAIITALENVEMENILPILTCSGRLHNDKHLMEYGFLTKNPKKKIAYASQQATGMIDAAILATELILQFKPKILIMAGVLGGKPNEVNIGDVVVATRTFTIDKGKINEIGFKKEIETTSNESSQITRLMREKKNIVEHLRKQDETRDSKIDIHFGPIGCVRQVIDLEGYFDTNIIPIDRKAVALEMESYAVSRACELVNNGNTKALIIKSAMDNTVDKLDGAKKYAAWASAQFIQYILEKDII